MIELDHACFSFENGRSKLKLWAFKDGYQNQEKWPRNTLIYSLSCVILLLVCWFRVLDRQSVSKHIQLVKFVQHL